MNSKIERHSYKETALMRKYALTLEVRMLLQEDMIVIFVSWIWAITNHLIQKYFNRNNKKEDRAIWVERNLVPLLREFK